MLSIRDYKIGAVSWLNSIKNGDSGWGLFEESPSRVVNTAEAILGLSLGTTTGVDYASSLIWLSNIVQGKFELKAKFQRHFAWIAYALSSLGGAEYSSPIVICTEWLMSHQYQDGGWGHEPGRNSSIYATYLSLRGLTSVVENNIPNLDHRKIRENIDQATLFLIRKQNKDNGWGYKPGEDSNIVATSFGILGLLEAYKLSKLSNPLDDRAVKDAANYVYRNIKKSREIFCEENVSGDFKYSFHHFATTWCLSSLAHTGYPLYERTLWDEFKYFLSLRSEAGGWPEMATLRPTVYSTYNALDLLKTLAETFHPDNQLLDLIDKKNEMELSAYQTESELKNEIEKKDLEIQNLIIEIRSLTEKQELVEHEKYTSVHIGYRSFQLQLSEPLFIGLSIIFFLIFIIFLTIANSQPILNRYLGLSIFSLLGTVITHIIGAQMLKWKNDITIPFDAAVLAFIIGIYFAIAGP